MHCNTVTVCKSASTNSFSDFRFPKLGDLPRTFSSLSSRLRIKIDKRSGILFLTDTVSFLLHLQLMNTTSNS